MLGASLISGYPLSSNLYASLFWISKLDSLNNYLKRDQYSHLRSICYSNEFYCPSVCTPEYRSSKFCLIFLKSSVLLTSKTMSIVIKCDVKVFLVISFLFCSLFVFIHFCQEKIDSMCLKIFNYAAMASLYFKEYFCTYRALNFP